MAAKGGLAPLKEDESFEDERIPAGMKRAGEAAEQPLPAAAVRRRAAKPAAQRRRCCRRPALPLADGSCRCLQTPTRC